MSTWKLEKDVAQKALPELLRELAQTLEGDPGAYAGQGEFPGLAAHLGPGGLRELELSIEDRGGAFRVKLAARGREAGAGKAAKQSGEAARQRDKYRQLKKAMQADYKELLKAVEAGRLPEADTLESFLSLSEAMAEVEQPASGAFAAELAQASAAFLEDARALKRAYGRHDTSALAEVLGRLERRKSACHAQFR